MNKEIFEKYGLSITKEPNGSLDVQTENYLLKGYLHGFYALSMLEGVLYDIDLALDDKFDQIEDPDWTMDNGPMIIWWGYIRPNHEFELSYNDNIDEKVYYPLSDMKLIFENILEIVES
jgi:hypothetical protein